MFAFAHGNTISHVYAYIQHTELAHLQQCVLFIATVVTVYAGH